MLEKAVQCGWPLPLISTLGIFIASLLNPGANCLYLLCVSNARAFEWLCKRAQRNLWLIQHSSRGSNAVLLLSGTFTTGSRGQPGINVIDARLGDARRVGHLGPRRVFRTQRLC